MTDSSITPITAASNGGATTDSSPQEVPASPATPERGIARLRETEVYHLMSLVQSALYEAEHLVSEVLGRARCRCDGTGLPGSSNRRPASRTPTR